jgi:thioredoxin reductase (NADPH)
MMIQKFHEISDSSLIVGSEACVHDNSLKDIQTGNRRNVDTEGVFIFVGFAPNNQLPPAGTKINTAGHVIADEKCETDIPGIFAVDDLRQKYANQIVLPAAGECTAALAAAHHAQTRKVGQMCQGVG